jgi:hypothetical protein
MGIQLADLTQHPEIVGWLTLLPADDDRDRLRDQYAAESDKPYVLRRRQQERQQRIEAIDLALIEASAKASDILLLERATIAAKLRHHPPWQGEILRRVREQTFGVQA